MRKLIRFRFDWSCRARAALQTASLLIPGLLGIHVAAAAELYNDSDWIARWDNTVKYSVGVRTTSPSGYLLSNPNTDDPDRNFDSGVFSNRFDLLSEFDIRFQEKFGISASAAGWYDSIYNRTNSNDSPATANQYSQPFNRFTDQTRNIEGREVELLNAYAFGTLDLGGVPISLRAGRYSLIWGESLFFARNGIANGMSPIDAIKLVSVPNIEAKELFMPQTQVSVEAQLTPTLSVAGYYQLQWRRTRLPAAGSYFSPADFFDAGGERLILVPPVLGAAGNLLVPGAALYREADRTPNPGGSAGLSVRWSHAGFDFGLYLTQFDDHDPQFYAYPGQGNAYVTPGTIGPGGTAVAGVYQEVFQRHVQAFGMSVSTSIGPFNVAGEVSGRHNMDLQSGVVFVLPGQQADGGSHALYAIGDTFHYQGSVIYLGPATRAFDAMQVAAEVAGAHVIKITKNASAFNQADSMNALGMRAVLTPTWYQVLPALDLNAPLGLGWNFIGNAPTDPDFNGGANRAGDVSLGLSATYRIVWTAGISYTRYMGPPSRNYLADRDFVSFVVQRTF